MKLIYKNILFISFITLFFINKISYKMLERIERIKIIIISCPKDGMTLNLNISLFPFEVDVVKCNKSTNSYDGREAGLMLDYIIKHYYNIKYEKYLFLHDHDVSSHYTSSITKRINKICKQDFIYKNDFIGVNCFYYDVKYWNNHLFYHKTEIVEKYLAENNIEHVKISHIRKNKYIMPCCASFFVKIKLIYLHKRQYYISLRNALRNFSMFGFNNYISKQLLHKKYRNYLAGSYMEFIWSTMFGQKNVPFPPDCNISCVDTNKIYQRAKESIEKQSHL